MTEEKNPSDLFRKWLTDENIFKSTIKDERLNFGFNFTFPPGSPVTFSVVQQKNMTDSVIVTLGIQVSQEHQRIMRSWPSQRKKEFLYTIMTELHRLNSEFNPRIEGDILLGIGFAKRIFVSELSKAEFWQIVVSLNSMRNLFVLLIQKETETLGFGPKGKPDTSPADMRMYG